MVAWSAVAVNVALARFLHGKRDFVPDVVEALRNNDGARARCWRRCGGSRFPIAPHAATGRTVTPGLALDDAEAALRLAYHEPLLGRASAPSRSRARSRPDGRGSPGRSWAPATARTPCPRTGPKPVDRQRLGALAARLVRVEPAGIA